MAKRKIPKGGSVKTGHTETKKPLPPEEVEKLNANGKYKLTHHEVNYGNVLELVLKMISNMNTNLTEIARDIKEIKDGRSQRLH